MDQEKEEGEQNAPSRKAVDVTQTIERPHFDTSTKRPPPRPPGAKDKVDSSKGVLHGTAEPPENVPHEDVSKSGNAPTIVDSNAQKRARIVQELLTTERTYMKNLHLVIERYVVPVRKSLETRNPIVPSKHFTDIFFNLEDIYATNHELLLTLEKLVGTWNEAQRLGPTFLEMVPKFKTKYMDYVMNHKLAILAVNKCAKHTAFVMYCEKMTEEIKLDLPSLLIQPVQRIPRYRLLLDDLIKKTSEEHPDYADLKKASREVASIAGDVDKQMDKQENLIKCCKIKNSFVGNVPKSFLSPDRVFIREGSLVKICRKMPKKRWFFLFNDALMYASILKGDEQQENAYRREATGKNRYQFHRLVLFSQEKVRVRDKEDTEDLKNAFQILSSSKSFTVYAKTPPLKEAWLNDLKAQLHISFQGPEDATGGTGIDEVEGAPVWVPDKETTYCQMCAVAFTVYRRRHHCRNCGKVVCGACSSKKRKLAKLKKDAPVRVCTFCYNFLGIQSKENQHEQEKAAEKEEVEGERPNEKGKGKGNDKKDKEREKNNKSKKPAVAKEKKSPSKDKTKDKEKDKEKEAETLEGDTELRRAVSADQLADKTISSNSPRAETDETGKSSPSTQEKRDQYSRSRKTSLSSPEMRDEHIGLARAADEEGDADSPPPSTKEEKIEATGKKQPSQEGAHEDTPTDKKPSSLKKRFTVFSKGAKGKQNANPMLPNNNHNASSPALLMGAGRGKGDTTGAAQARRAKLLVAGRGSFAGKEGMPKDRTQTVADFFQLSAHSSLTLERNGEKDNNNTHNNHNDNNTTTQRSNNGLLFSSVSLSSLPSHKSRKESFVVDTTTTSTTAPPPPPLSSSPNSPPPIPPKRRPTEAICIPTGGSSSPSSSSPSSFSPSSPSVLATLGVSPMDFKPRTAHSPKRPPPLPPKARNTVVGTPPPQTDVQHN